MAQTAQTLIQQLARRLGEFWLSTATSAGTTTTIVDTGLNRFFPVALNSTGNQPMNAWIYPVSGTATNLGYEARTVSWTPSTLTTTAMPHATASADTFEIHLRTRRPDKLEAINEAIGWLDIMCSREIVDTSITTEQGKWKYTLPSTQNWHHVRLVELQVNTDTTYPTYPYADTTVWNWKAYPVQDPTTGVETWYLQFGLLPPPNRVLRIFGDGYFSNLVNDSDLLVTAGAWERQAMTWVYDYGMWSMMKWLATSEPSFNAGRLDAQYDRLMQSLQQIKSLMKPQRGNRIITPGKGDGEFGLYPTTSADGSYLGAFENAHSV